MCAACSCYQRNSSLAQRLFKAGSYLYRSRVRGGRGSPKASASETAGSGPQHVAFRGVKVNSTICMEEMLSPGRDASALLFTHRHRLIGQPLSIWIRFSFVDFPTASCVVGEIYHAANIGNRFRVVPFCFMAVGLITEWTLTSFISS